MKILFKDQEKNLLGNQVYEGQKAPCFKAVKKDMSEFKLKDLKGKVVIITSYPSVDTSVCSLQAATFNEEAKKHKDISIVTISLDLPFALSRHCSANNIENTTVLSDYQTRDFAYKYGMLIEDLYLLARAVFVIDKDQKIRYIEVCDQITNEPNYDKALEKALELV